MTKAITNGTEVLTGLVAVRPLWALDDDWLPEGWEEVEIEDNTPVKSENTKKPAEFSGWSACKGRE